MNRAERIDGAAVLTDEQAARAVAARFEAGEIGIYPTETIYGIGGRADWESVRERIFAAKGRAATNPLIVVSAERAPLNNLGVFFPPAAERLARSCWPGGLTLVVPHSNGGDLAVRVSDHPFLQTLGRYLPLPLFSSSANPSGSAYDPDPRHIFESFVTRVDFVIDAGWLPPSPPSSVVRVAADGVVTLLREGVVSRGEIERALGRGLSS